MDVSLALAETYWCITYSDNVKDFSNPIALAAYFGCFVAERLDLRAPAVYVVETLFTGYVVEQ